MNRLLKRAHSTTHNVPLPLIHTHSPRAPPSATLYTIPQHAPDLPKLLHHLQHTFPNSIGCLSSSSPSISIAHFYDTDRTTYHLFRSTEKGKAPAAVGRWRPPGEISGLEGLKKDDDVLEDAFARGDWAGVWGDGTPGGNSPQEQVELAGLEGVERSQIQTALLLSTPASLSPTVHLLPPGSQKAGLIVPQTPFTTGRPHTLFHHTNAYSEGAVGLAIVAHQGAESTKDRLEVGWEGMELVEDRVYQVSGSQGNLLLSLTPTSSSPSSSSSANQSISNPTKHLIALLQASPSTDFNHKSYLGGKEKEFFLGFVHDRSPFRTGSGSTRDTVGRVVRILSGDPARGGMAIEMEDSLLIGEKVVFLHRPSNGAQDKEASKGRDSSTITFRTSPATTSDPLAFDATSEAGFIVGFEEERAFADKGIEGGRVIVHLAE